MKKLFIILVSVLILGALVVIVFALTFDANRYKGTLITKLEESMGKDVRIDNISLSLLAGFGFEAKGVIIKDKGKTWDDFLLKAKSFNVNISILPLLKKDIQIQRLSVPELEISAGTGPASPVFRCSLDLKARILINSLSQDDLLKTLSAKGNIRLEKAVLNNTNILKTALDQLSMLPGLVQELKDNLPEKYSGSLSQDYTAFKPISADFEMRNGRIYFDKLLVESDIFYLVSKGYAGIIDQSLQIDSNLFIPSDLSGAFISTASEFKYLMDNNGLITMPLKIKGKIPDISVMPDLNYVLRKLIVPKGRDILDKLFKDR